MTEASRKVKLGIAAIVENEYSAIDLNHLSISDDLATEIAGALRHNDAMVHLSLSHNAIGPAGAKALAEALSHNRSLTFLELSGNPLEIEGAQALAAGMAHNRVVKIFRISKRSLDVGIYNGRGGKLNVLLEGSGYSTLELAFIAETFKVNDVTLVLQLRGLGLSTQLCALWGDMLAHNTRLRTLVVTNVLKEPGFPAIVAGLETNRTLMCLDYQNSDIGIDGINKLVSVMRENAALKQLRLYDNDLDATEVMGLCDALRDHPSLDTLLIFKNDVNEAAATSLAQLLRDNTRIRYLGLDSNPIRTAGALALMAAARDSTTLTALDLTSTRLFGDELEPLLIQEGKVRMLSEIERAEVEDRVMTAMCDMVRHNNSLQMLLLTGNHLQDRHGLRLGEAARCNSTLVKLRMTTEDLPVQDLAGRSDCPTLSFAGTDIAANDMNFMCTLIQRNRYLLTLNLANTHLRLDGVRLLARALAFNGVIQMVRIVEFNIPVQNWRGANYCDDLYSEQPWFWQDCVIVGELLKQNETCNVISLSSNGIDETGIPFIADALRVNNACQQFELVWNCIGARGMVSLASALAVNTSIDTLLLHGAAIGSAEGARALADLIERNTTITNLIVRWNTLAEDGIAVVAPALLKHQTITALDLRANELGDVGAATVARMLDRNTAIVDLVLSENSIGPVGAEHLCDSLMRPQCVLESIALDWNPITPEGSYWIAEMLRLNTTIRNLSVSKCGFYNEGATAVADMLRVNRALEDLYMVDPTVGPAGVRSIAEAVTYNRIMQRIMFSAFEIPVQEWNGQHGDQVVNLSDQDMSILDIMFLSECLKLNRECRFLDLSGNNFKPLGAAFLREAMEHNMTIERVRFDKVTLRVQDLNGVTGLTQVDYSAQPVCLCDTVFIATSLATNNPLQFLNMSDCNLGLEAAETLGKNLKRNSVLSAIRLRGNKFMDAGALHLAEILAGDNVLQVLDVSDCGIEEEGAAALGSACQNNANVRYVKVDKLTHRVQDLRGSTRKERLDYSAVRMEIVDVAFMTVVLKFNEYTSALDFSHNALDNPCTYYVGHMLEVNRCLREVDYSHNACNWMGGDTFIKVLQVNRALTALRLINTRVGKKSSRLIAEMLEVNQRCVARWVGGRMVAAKEYFPNGDYLELPNVGFLGGTETDGDYVVARMGALERIVAVLEGLMSIATLAVQLSTLVEVASRGLWEWVVVLVGLVSVSVGLNVAWASKAGRPPCDMVLQALGALLLKQVVTLLRTGRLVGLTHDIRNDIPRLPWIEINKLRLWHVSTHDVLQATAFMFIGTAEGFTSLMTAAQVLSSISIAFAFSAGDLGPIRQALWTEERDEIVEDGINYAARALVDKDAAQKQAAFHEARMKVIHERARSLNIEDYKREALKVDVEWFRADTIVTFIYRAIEVVARPALLALFASVVGGAFWVWFLFSFIAYCVYWSFYMSTAVYDDTARFIGLASRVCVGMLIFPGFNESTPRWVSNYTRTSPAVFFMVRFVEETAMLAIVINDAVQRFQKPLPNSWTTWIVVLSIARFIVSGPYWIVANVDADARVHPRRHAEVTTQPSKHVAAAAVTGEVSVAVRATVEDAAVVNLRAAKSREQSQRTESDMERSLVALSPVRQRIVVEQKDKQEPDIDDPFDFAKALGPAFSMTLGSAAIAVDPSETEDAPKADAHPEGGRSGSEDSKSIAIGIRAGKLDATDAEFDESTAAGSPEPRDAAVGARATLVVPGSRDVESAGPAAAAQLHGPPTVPVGATAPSGSIDEHDSEKELARIFRAKARRRRKERKHDSSPSRPAAADRSGGESDEARERRHRRRRHSSGSESSAGKKQHRRSRRRAMRDRLRDEARRVAVVRGVGSAAATQQKPKLDAPYPPPAVQAAGGAGGAVLGAFVPGQRLKRLSDTGMKDVRRLGEKLRQVATDAKTAAAAADRLKKHRKKHRREKRSTDRDDDRDERARRRSRRSRRKESAAPARPEPAGSGTVPGDIG